MPLGDFIGRLDRVSAHGSDRWRAVCPAHESKRRTQSLAVRELPDGTVLVKCFAGCDVASITAAVGMELRELLPADTSRMLGARTPQQRAMYHAQRQALETLHDEIAVVCVLLNDLSLGVLPSERDLRRADKAAQLIGEAVKCVLGR